MDLVREFIPKNHRAHAVQAPIPYERDAQGLLRWARNDPENPKNWKRSTKWFYTFVSIMVVSNASMASSTTSGCLESISERLHVSVEAAKLTVTLFLLGYVAGPCIWAPLSEFFGRQVVYLSTFVAYVGFTFLCAFTPNFTGLLLGRFFTGVFISGALSNTPGLFADLWEPVERAKCMTLFSVALQMGPAIGPITSGFYQLTLDWRWTFYQLLWTGGACLPLLLFIPETHPAILLERKAKRIRLAASSNTDLVRAPSEVQPISLLQTFRTALSRPWILLLDPICFFVAIYMTVVYTLLYMLFTIFPIVFIQKQGWNSGVGELPLLSIVVGGLLGAALCFWHSGCLRRKIENGHIYRTEDTSPVSIIAALIFPIAMFWLAWTGQYNSIHWIVPTLAAVAISFVIVLQFVSFLGCLSEVYLRYAASAQATNQIVRSAVAASAPLWTEQMFGAMGVGGGGSLIGGVAVLLMPIPILFYRYGEDIRRKSKWAPTKSVQTEVGAEKESSEGEEEKEKLELERGDAEIDRSHPGLV